MNRSLNHHAEVIRDYRLENGFSVKCLDRADIFALGDQWERLSRNVIEENPYYSPSYMHALLENIETQTDVKALAVFHDTTLVGFLPFVIDTWRWLKAMPVNRAWIHPYTTLSIPLIAVSHPREIVDVLVEAMREHGGRGAFWLYESFNLEGPVGKLFDDVLKDRNLPSKSYDEFDRATLDQGSSFDEHMLRHVSKSRRKGLKRNRKNLSELGRLEMRNFTSGPELEIAVDEFLALEISGWKGEQGSAMACDERTKAFAKRAFGSEDGKSITRADVLYLDDCAIAVSLAIYVGKTAFTLKCSYDESYRSYSPGLLLEQDIIEDFFESQWVERLDSATNISGHVVQGLWNSSIRVGDLLLCADDTKSVDNFKNYAQLEKMRRLLRGKLKSIVAKTRGG